MRNIHPTDELSLMLSIIMAAATGVNIFVGLRLAALQAKMKADSAALEVSLLRQFVAWKDEVLGAINGKYVSAALVTEIRHNIGHELTQIDRRLQRLEDRCSARSKDYSLQLPGD